MVRLEENNVPEPLLLDLCFQLQEAPANEVDWHIHFLVASKQDPSCLSNYWVINQKAKTGLVKHFGKDFANLLLNLGYAAMYPKLWQGLETSHWVATMEEAFEFLKRVPGF